MTEDAVQEERSNLASAFAGVVILLGFAAAKYWLDSGFPEWLVLVLIGIGGLTLFAQYGMTALIILK